MGHPFVHTLSACWRRPSLTALEVLWRWVYGIPAMALLGWQMRRVLLGATDGTLDPARLGLDRALLHDPVGSLSAAPMEAAAKFSRALGLVSPGLWVVGRWLGPALLVGWIVASSLGRTALLRRADPRLRARPLALMVLQGIRMIAMAAIFLLWFESVAWSARAAINQPIAAGADPNLILFCAAVIVLSLGLFTLWAFVSWGFAAAPLLAMSKGTGVAASLAAAFGLRPLRARLIEVNLVMGIVKIALLVLLMVFSATPLPFESVTSPEFLSWWWAGVVVAYLLWSDFFHAVRLVGYLNLWRSYQGQTAVE